jgi:hypothetical protein
LGLNAATPVGCARKEAGIDGDLEVRQGSFLDDFHLPRGWMNENLDRSGGNELRDAFSR